MAERRLDRELADVMRLAADDQVYATLTSELLPGGERERHLFSIDASPFEVTEEQAHALAEVFGIG